MKATERAEAAVECSCGVNATLRGEHWRKCPVTRVAAALEDVMDEVLEEAAREMCIWCYREWPYDPTHGGSRPGHRFRWHVDPQNARVHHACSASRIRALKTPRKDG